MSKFVQSDYFKPLITLMAMMMILSTLTPGIALASSETYSDEELDEIQKIEEELEFYYQIVGEFNEDGQYIIKDEELLLEKVEAGEEMLLLFMN